MVIFVFELYCQWYFKRKLVMRHFLYLKITIGLYFHQKKEKPPRNCTQQTHTILLLCVAPLVIGF